MSNMSEEIKNMDIEDVQNDTPKGPKKIKKGLNESAKIVLAISILALVAALLLSIINHYTKQDADKAMRDVIAKVYDSPVESWVNLSNYKPVEKTQIETYGKAEDGAHIVISKSEKGYNAAGVSLVVVIKDGKISKVAVFSHSETPGLGDKALKETYFEQYIGISIDRFVTDDDYIITSPSSNDGIFKPQFVSGATRTSTAVQEAILAAVRVVKYYGDGA
ncbi:MAG: FMN-binding protein [Clostridiales bacterium]|nr:FMN-binding protein [Clostridiales bacterium]